MKWAWVPSLLAFLFCVQPSLAQNSDLIEILRAELQRNFATLQEKADPKPYYLSYTVTERETILLDASLGSMRVNQRQHQRHFDVSIRVGEAQLDNYHRVQGGRGRVTSGSAIVLEDKRDAIVRILWRDTDRAFRAASERLNLIRSSAEMRVAERDQSPDFSEEVPEVDVQAMVAVPFNAAGWEPKLKKWSSAFRGHEEILTSAVTLALPVENRYFVDSDGASLRHGSSFVRVDVSGQTKAADGMNLGLSRGIQAETPGKLDRKSVV